MAVIDWPAAFGYAEFSEQPHRSRGPYVHRSAFTGAVHVSYGGGRRRRGYVVTPASPANGEVQPAITALVQDLSDPANQLRLRRPGLAGLPAETMTVHVTRIQPPERDERGVWRGWRLEFAEIGPVGAPPPTPVRVLACPSLAGMLTAKADDSGFDVSIPVTQALVDETMRTVPANSQIVSLRYQLYSGRTAPGLMTSLTTVTDVQLSGLAAGTPITFSITEAVRNAHHYSLQAQWERADGTVCPIAVVGTHFLEGFMLPLRQTGDTAGASDSDRYQFTLPAETSVLATLMGLTHGAAGQTGFRVYAADGTATALWQRSVTGVALHDSATLAAGSYYVNVGGTDGNADAQTNTPYALAIYAPDYSPMLPLSESGDIVGASDIDIYPFSHLAETSVDVTLTGLTSGNAGDTGFQVWQADGTAVAGSKQTTGSGADLSASLTLAAGNYYVVVGGFDGDSDADTNTSYSLSVTEGPYILAASTYIYDTYGWGWNSGNLQSMLADLPKIGTNLSGLWDGAAGTIRLCYLPDSRANFRVAGQQARPGHLWIRTTGGELKDTVLDDYALTITVDGTSVVIAQGATVFELDAMAKLFRPKDATERAAVAALANGRGTSDPAVAGMLTFALKAS